MGILYVLDGGVRFATEEVTFWFLHAVHPRFADFGPSPTEDEEGYQGRKEHEAWQKVGGAA
jgi:hypothetical protein